MQARSQDIAGDSWTPHVLLIDATEVETGDLDDLHHQLSALSTAGRVATAVVMRGGSAPVPPVAGAHVTSDGTLSLPVILGADRCAAAALTDADLGRPPGACSSTPNRTTPRSHRRPWTSRGRRTWTTPVR